MAGWKRQAGGRDDVVGWSTWTSQDDEGDRVDAFFLTLRHAGADRYFLFARASRDRRSDIPAGQT